MQIAPEASVPSKGEERQNGAFGGKRFTEETKGADRGSVPDILVGEVPSLPGIDGRAKMSKSLDNAIFLSDDAETVKRKVNSMYTDPTRVHPTDPGHVEGNPVFIYHDAFNPDAAEVEELRGLYRRGKVGDVEVKSRLVKALNNFLDRSGNGDATLKAWRAK